MIKGEMVNKLDFYQECVLAKHTRVSFCVGKHGSKMVLTTFIQIFGD